MKSWNRTVIVRGENVGRGKWDECSIIQRDLNVSGGFDVRTLSFRSLESSRRWLNFPMGVVVVENV